MFDKLKQMKELRDMQSQAQQEKFEGERNGTKVIINGTLTVEDITLNQGVSVEEQQQHLKEAFNDALKKAQMSMMQKFQGMM